MPHTSTLRQSLVALTFAALTLSASAAAFGGAKDANIKVERGNTLKGKSTIAIGAFRVAFVLEDSAVSTSHGAFSNGGSSSKMSGSLDGIDHALMQKIADEIYADFLKQAAAKGYTVIDSAKLATLSSSYREMTATTNFAPSRVGTLVIPTGQRSVAMAADDSAKEEKGSSSFGTAFHNLSKQIAKSDADKAFPKAAKEADAAVIGVTLVVNFANWHGTSSGFGSSKATMKPGATIDGQIPKELAVQTALIAWDAGTCDHAGCPARLIQEGQIHSDESIALSSATAGHTDFFFGTSNKIAVLTADPVAYEKNVLAVAAEASDMLLSAAAKER